MEGLDKIVSEMRIYPIQTNSTKCAFGHFYNAIHIDHEKIIDNWKQIDRIHHSFHSLGDKVIDAVKQNDRNSAKEAYNEASDYSVQMLNLLAEVKNKVQQLSKEGINIF